MQFTLVKKVMNSRIRFPFNTFFLNPVYVAARSLRSNYKQEAISQKEIVFRFRKDIQSEKGWRFDILFDIPG